MTTKKELADQLCLGTSASHRLFPEGTQRSRTGTSPALSIRSRFAAGLLGCLNLVCVAPAEETAVAPAVAGTSPAAPPPAAVSPSAGLVNDWLRQQSPVFLNWDIGGQVRGRVEFKNYFAVPNEGAVDLARRGNRNNTYFLLRERVHLGYAPAEWLRLYGEMQDAGAYRDDRDPSPDNDHLMLRQAWVGLGAPQAFPVTLKAGRQELIYGDQRLVGMADWLNIGRVFDAAKLHYESEFLGGCLCQPAGHS